MLLQLLKSGPCQETIAIIQWLLKRALKADVRGVALCFRTGDDRDVVFLTGIFRNKPEAALAAAERLHQRAVMQLDLFP
jgi:GGDEF domain-containing protein